MGRSAVLKCRSIREGGFTFLEVLVVMGILSILMGIFVPQMMLADLEKRQADKIASEMKLRMDAARLYYLANKAWPTSFTVLKNQGYLPSSITDTIFGNNITMSYNSNYFTTTINVPNQRVRNLLLQVLPGSYVSSSTYVNSVVPVPGNEVALDGLKQQILDLLSQWELKNIKSFGLLSLQANSGFANVSAPTCKQGYAPQIFTTFVEISSGSATAPILYQAISISWNPGGKFWTVQPLVHLAGGTASPGTKILYFTTCN